MKKIRYTLATLMVAAIVAAVLVGCKKEKEPLPQLEGRKPIAMRMPSGEIISTIDVEKLSVQFSNSKDLADKIIVESVIIQDKTDNEPYYFIINYIDVENEVAYSSALEGNYVEEYANYFYLTKDVSEGNYGFEEIDGKIHKFENFEPVEPEPNYSPNGFWVNCKATNCVDGSCKAKHFHCTDCATQGGLCEYSSLGWGATIIVNIATQLIIKWLTSK